MAMIFTPLIAIWVIFLIWYYERDLRVIIPVIIGGIWGVGLAAFFTLPAFFEKKFVHVETMLMGYFNYLAHFVSLKQLFLSRFWGYGSSGWGPDDGMSFQVGHLHWIVPVVSLVVFFLLLFKKKINLRYFLLFTFYFLLFLGSAFLTHLRSTPIWQAVKPLEYLQFPWRFLAIVIFAVSFASGSFIFSMKKVLGIELLSLGLIVAVVASNFGYFKPEKILKITDEEKLFSPKGWYKLQTDAIFDYLPIYAEKPPAEPAPEDPEILEGKVGITNLKRGTNWYRFEAKVLDGQAKIRLPIYDFPGWKVSADKRPVEIEHDNFLGLITFGLPSGNHRILARFTNTPLRAFSNLISFFSWGALGLILSK